MKVSGEKYTFEEHMLMNIYDRINWLAWTKTKDARHGLNPPEPIREVIAKQEQAEENKLRGFESPHDLNEYLRRSRGGGKNG